ncbi:MAG TPA: PIN domain-containing protein [Chthoniobacterales bacterium]|nr:PIN domain-containing protein [Chthoniobacterales bacterium]
MSKHPQVKVVFDTNVIYTGTAHDLLNAKITALIEEYRNAKDITVHWCLPDVVLREREFQMVERGAELLPAIERLERLLGHNLAFTHAILKERVHACTTKQIADVGLELVDVDAASVDWQSVIDKSTNRLPPFEKGDKEKGFRDAVILETFRQVVNQSPASPKECRVVLLTEDALLGEAASAAVANIPNARIAKGIEELRGLINVLTSEVKEELIAQVKDKVAILFFDQENEAGLYFSDTIRDRIITEHAELLAAVPPGEQLIRKNGTWFIYPPEFSRKTGQRVSWRTRIVVASKLFKRTSLDPVNLTAPPAPRVAPLSITEVLEAQKEILVKDGRTTFQVDWSVLVQTNLKLRSPKIEGVKYVDTDWEKKAV